MSLDLTLVADHLRTTPGPFKKVYEASEFAKLSETRPPSHNHPCLYVIPVSEKAGPNGSATGRLRQEVTQVFGIVIAKDSKADKRGSAALDEIQDLYEDLRSKLLDWTPSEELDPVEFDTGQLLSMRNGVTYWQDNFRTRFHIFGSNN